MSSDRRLTHLSSPVTFQTDSSMNIPSRIVLLSALAFTLTTGVLAQRRDPKNAVRKSATSASVLCEGDLIPRGYVIVGYKSSTTCGAKSEVVIKKPEEAEIVCSGSPIPDGYHVANQMSSADCLVRGAAPFANALSIVSNVESGSGSANRSNVSYDRFEDVSKVQMPEELLYRDPPNSEFDPAEIYIAAAYVFKGQTPSPPRSVAVFFRYRVLFDLGFDSVSFIADGQRFRFESALKMNRTDTVENKYGGYTSYSNSTYVVEMPLNSFLAIVNSSSIEMRAAGREFNLSGGALGALRRFANGIKG
jgi:hypothetical protein